MRAPAAVNPEPVRAGSRDAGGHARACLAAVLVLVAVSGCSRSTARLSPEMGRRIESEGILRRADDVLVRYTRGPGGRGSRWEEWTASVVLSRRTLLIHRTEESLVEVTAGDSEGFRVRRDHDRLILREESGRSSRSWSFRPPGDAEGWAKDIRAMMRGTADTTGTGG